MRLQNVLLVALVLSVAACGPSDPPQGDAAAGRALAERNCQSCHAIGGTGASPVADAPPFRELVTRWPAENLAEALAEGIQVSHQGQVQMPEFQFDPGDIDNLIAYLNTLAPQP